jgi:tRNA threonylcarbamoyl adenosine modification protein YeaZ
LILSFDTSTKAFSVALYSGREMVNLEIVRDTFHSQNIVGVTDFLLKSIDASIKEVSEIYAGIGPGSFTGIRIGLSFANTLLETMDIPLAGICSLDLLAFDEDRWYNAVVSFIKSRKNEVYTAAYRNARRTSEYLALEKEEFKCFIRDNSPTYIVASEEDYESLSFEQGLGEIEIVHAFPKAQNAYPLAQQCKLTPDRRYLKPLYVRDF